MNQPLILPMAFVSHLLPIQTCIFPEQKWHAVILMILTWLPSSQASGAAGACSICIAPSGIFTQRLFTSLLEGSAGDSWPSFSVDEWRWRPPPRRLGRGRGRHARRAWRMFAAALSTAIWHHKHSYVSTYWHSSQCGQTALVMHCRCLYTKVACVWFC